MLREEGVTDFGQYLVAPGEPDPPFLDMFGPDEIVAGIPSRVFDMYGMDGAGSHE